MKTIPVLNDLKTCLRNVKLNIEKYGLNIQSQFPLPVLSSNTGQISYYSRTGTLFSQCSNEEEKLLQQYLKLSYKDTLPIHGIWAHTYLKDGFLVNLPAELSSTEPYIIEIEAHQNTAIAYVLLVVRENSNAQVVIQYKNTAPSHTIVNVICEKKSELSLLVCTAQSLHPHYVQVQSTIFDQAHLKQLALARNANMLQSYTSTHVLGEKASVYQSHISLSRYQEKHDIYSDIIHTGDHSISEMQSKIILHDEAHTIYRGMTTMNQSAINCESTQKEQTLLLGGKAKIDVVPMLAITNDAIQCNHSASISNLDTEQLFYLQSRGLAYEEAEKLIIQGFYSDILKNFSNLALCALIHDYLNSEFRVGQ